MHERRRRVLGRVGAVALVLSLGLAGLGAGFAAAEGTPNDNQYTNPGSTEPTTTPTNTSTEPTTTPTNTSTKPTTTPTNTSTEPNGTTAGASGGGEPPTVAGDTLPFTGLNLVVLIGLGGALILAGLALRRAGRRDN